MKLALCIICEGDIKLESVQNAVESTNGICSSVHITANQEPYNKLEAWCKEKGYDFSYLKWNDNFSEQRMFNFSRAPKDTDLWLWMDSDDVIIHPEIILNIADIAKQNEYDVVFFDYWYGAKFDGKPSLETFVEKELTQKRERLINFRKVQWGKRIHETPVPLDGNNFRYTAVPYSKEYPIVWLHLGGDRDMGQDKMIEKMNRNTRLLELELNDERRQGQADPRTILYLMKVYAESDQGEILQTCLQLGEEYLGKSGWDQERAVCLELMAKCMGKLGLHKEAKTHLLNAIDEYPYNPLLYLYLARTYFNLGDYRAMEFWMKIGMSLDLDETNTSMGNILELKVLSAELLLEFNLRGKKDIRKAYEAAVMLNTVNPSENNKNNVKFLKEMAELDEATEHAHKLLDWCKENKREDKIQSIIETLPENIQNLPFMIHYLNQYKTPKIWGEKEICYFANFGQEHIEKWDGNSLKAGIGGSETAVVRLAEEWAKEGWKVTVYGDPKQEIMINGVLYVPFYKFNQKDLFNIFIQWRHPVMAGKVTAKKFYVDLHDVTHPSTFDGKIDSIDGIFVKSEYHKSLLEGLPKTIVISNGI